MRDPHVETLRYRLEPSNTVIFDNAQAVEWDTDLCHMRLENNTLTCQMKEHFGLENEAKQAVEQLLRAWEISAALDAGRDQMRFHYVNADIIDRDPPPPGSPQAILLGSVTLTASGEVTWVHYRSECPAPPQQFKLTPEVEILWRRYSRYLEGHESLLGLAYLCLTVIEHDGFMALGGKRRVAASRYYAIDKDVLDTFGRLTSERGNLEIARKVVSTSQTPLTGAEEAWIQAVTMRIIQRIGEREAVSYSASLPQIEMKDFPKLPP